MKTYTIKKIDGSVTEESWSKAETAKVDYIPWSDTCVCPYYMEARLLYTDEALYVNLCCDEQPVQALCNQENGPVWEDSCMEFFFAPDKDDPHYFNFEMNPLGVLLLHHGTDRDHNTVPEDDHKIFDAKSVITRKGWQLFYKIPFSFILKYFEKITEEMRGNFYKCGDNTAIPHHACWNPVTCPEPDFHQPGYFGMLKFEKGISVSR